MPTAIINSLGTYLPKKILTNFDLEKMVDTTDSWIKERTGIEERRIADDEETTSILGFKAASAALQNGNCSPDEIELIILATTTSDYPMPSSAALIQAMLKATNAGAFDIQAACSGFIYGLTLAKAYIEANIYKKILLVASDKLSSVINYEDRNTCILFGDGAVAALISNEGEGLEIKTSNLGAEGIYSQHLLIPAGGSKKPASEDTVKDKLHSVKMEGKEVFKHAIRRMAKSSLECLEKLNIQVKDINWVIPHQANFRIMETLAKQLEIPFSKVFRTVHKYGNTSAASVGIALSELLESQEVKPNDHLLLTAFGSGFTWGSVILKKTETND